MKTKFGKFEVKMLVDDDLLLIENLTSNYECLFTDGRRSAWTNIQRYNVAETWEIYNVGDLILINNYFFTGKLFIWNGNRD